jgi:NADP-dependent 3-hydroxy acid dehydrogenase YdfG
VIGSGDWSDRASGSAELMRADEIADEIADAIGYLLTRPRRVAINEILVRRRNSKGQFAPARAKRG